MVLNFDCVNFMNLQRENVEKTTDTVSFSTSCPSLIFTFIALENQNSDFLH